MAIDVHAHYFPPKALQSLRKEGERYGISVLDREPACACLHFEHGLTCRPFFPKLLESLDVRVDRMHSCGIHRQILSGWTDVFGYGLATAKGHAWHRLMNETLAEVAASDPGHFSILASGHIPDPAGAARELEYSVRSLGAVGGVVACNVEGTNLGELDLDEYWAAAVELDVPVFLHPAQPAPTPRVKKFALNQVAQYTFDTTLAIGSLIWSGVLDRFPGLKLIASHGGGSVPWLIGRFDCMHGRSDHAVTGIVARDKPSSYLQRFYYDTILHDGNALRYLSERVGVERLVIGSDDSFPPADLDPLASLRNAGFDEREIQMIGEDNPRRLFRLP
ncbi:amidohydrolase family protein [uncultured Pigmentiphaga sp.]|uniref:amidohydrolase family protein n=1 Tax=uncultured Pigmentiphaga sp. TaxID=340361 RepID=UPI00261DB533|nr:amidohydrolase family protein [uncultured Pigmentiphaga sp.]